MNDRGRLVLGHRVQLAIEKWVMSPANVGVVDLREAIVDEVEALYQEERGSLSKPDRKYVTEGGR